MSIKITKNDVFGGESVEIGNGYSITFGDVEGYSHSSINMRSILGGLGGKRLGYVSRNKDKVSNPVGITTKDGITFYTDGVENAGNIDKLKGILTNSIGGSIVSGTYEIEKSVVADKMGFAQNVSIGEFKFDYIYDPEKESTKQAYDNFAKKLVNEILGETLPKTLEEEQEKLKEDIEDIDNLLEELGAGPIWEQNDGPGM